MISRMYWNECTCICIVSRVCAEVVISDTLLHELISALGATVVIQLCMVCVCEPREYVDKPHYDSGVPKLVASSRGL